MSPLFRLLFLAAFTLMLSACNNADVTISGLGSKFSKMFSATNTAGSPRATLSDGTNTVTAAVSDKGQTVLKNNDIVVIVEAVQ